jgi:diaminopimelate epimerase
VVTIEIHVRESRVSVVFFKMTGSGNDFIVLDGRLTSPNAWSPERIVAICDRRNGVGADGLIFVAPEEPGSVRMTFFNNDGSRAPMCGNGALCTTRIAAHLEMADGAGMTLVTDAGSFRTRCTGPQHLAELNLPDTDVPRPTAIPLQPGEHWIRLGTVGVPHLVVLVDDVATVDLMQRGRALRFDKLAGKDGANVNFIGPIAGANVGNSSDPAWAVRTYERGVEGETLACGTGTVASALAIAATGLAHLPLRCASASGRLLSVNATALDGAATNIWLCGEGRLVAKGIWYAS